MMRSGFRTLSTLVLLGLLAMARNAAAEDCVVDLRTAHAGSLPDGFLAAVTGRGGPAVWAALDDPTTPSAPSISTSWGFPSDPPQQGA